MQTPSPPLPAADRSSRFPLVFEGIVWVLYAGLYKYSIFMQEAISLMSLTERDNLRYSHLFPYPQLMLFAGVATLYIVPYYRGLLPWLLRRRRYVLLGIGAVLYAWWGIKLNLTLAHDLFQYIPSPPRLAAYYHQSYLEAVVTLAGRAQRHITLLFTDMLAFSCVGFVRVAFEQEARRRHIEKEHAALQLEQLKAQLQPHFLFNTLNSIYGLSLAGSPETPRFILLLSELMRYVLYDSGKEYIELPHEVAFLENYFELEQRKYESASIRFTATGTEPFGRQVPPLLWLPLVENSFKHGRHHFSDEASVEATLTATPGTLHFVIENDMLPTPPPTSPRRSGGIGLENIRRRLQLYYPGAHQLHLSEHAGRYRAELILHA
ncbi:sensor histidine kinase [Hymenobacter profundi]|uniref:Sensor histidine kinase n=1 Tax=Hymenobacter profundi TaxID=1982110 RepID=A0ABS6WWM0_9BACT|nr:sensor histidine kinase [Hymenobacter profundi]MBW3127667.1 sensor histidine kinase [Hymenobacter profundi]